MPRQALDEPTLASDAPQGHSQTCPPIKQEPGSPYHFDHKGSNTRETHPEIYGMLTGYVSSSSSDDTGSQMLGILEDEGTTTIVPSRKAVAAEGQLDLSSGDTSAPRRQEIEPDTARAALQDSDGGTNGLLRPLPVLGSSPPPRQQRASGRPDDPGRHPGNKFWDVAYNSIPDYTPPLSSLPRSNPHILQVEWRKDGFFDLSNDPDRHLLHEAELKLAKSLHLICAKYLCTKRRIFQVRFEALQAGREFKKTDSIQACRISVNKASKLCGVFEKVGWFDEKYFLKYLDESNNTLGKANSESKDSGSLSSGLTEPDIWDVSESEFHFTSEGDEESTDDDTADSIVSPDVRHDQTEGWRDLDSYRDNPLTEQHYGLSLISGDGSQRRVLIDKTVQAHENLCGDQTVDENPTIEDRRPRQLPISQGTMYPGNPDDLSGNETQETPILETRSRTKNFKLALNSRRSLTDPALGSDDLRDSGSITQPKISSLKQRQQLLAAEAEIEGNFQREKADIIAEIESNFQSEKWNLVAEAMSRNGSCHHSAESIQALHESLTRDSKSIDAKDEEFHNTFTDLPLRTPRAVREGKNKTSTSPRSDVGRLDEGSHATSQLQPQHTRLLLYQKRPGSKIQATTTLRGQKSTKRSTKCENCGRKYQSQAGLIYHCEHHPGCELTTPRSSKSKKRKLNSYSTPGHTQPTADRQGPFADRPAARVLIPKPMPHQTLTALPQANRNDSESALQAASLGPSGKGAEPGRQTVRKDKSQIFAEQSARARRVWAMRRVLGTNGRNGGPPKAKKAKMAVLSTAPNAGTSLAPTVRYQSGHVPDSLPDHTQPILSEQEVPKSDIFIGQMIFEPSSRKQSPELLISREDRELLGEVD